MKTRQRKQIEIGLWNSSAVTENQRERPEAPAVWNKRPIHTNPQRSGGKKKKKGELCPGSESQKVRNVFRCEM